MFNPPPHSPYKVESHLECDLSELIGLEKNIEKAIADGITAKDISDKVSPAHILWRFGAPMGIAVLMKHTPIGDDFSNWGYWDYGSYVLYGGDHAKGTLRRGWATTDPSDAENNLTLPIDYKHIRSHVERNVKVHRSGKTHYWCELENCVPYGPAVEYGHYIVYPGERNKWVSSHVGGAKPMGPIHSSGNGFGRFYPPQYFVKDATTETNWKPVNKVMHDEYVRRLRRVFKK